MPTRSETSRINGAKSHGPTTDEGRRAVSLNAVKHGLTAETVVLENESAEEYEAELQAYLQRFAPVDKPETDLVHQLAATQWRLVRYAAIESRLVNIAVAKQRERASKREWAETDELSRVALGFDGLAAAPHSSLALLNRYQARLHHEYQRILKSLLQLQAHRVAQPQLQNEPKQPPSEPLQPTIPAAKEPETEQPAPSPLIHISESDITESDYEGRRREISPAASGDPAHPSGLGG
jgi:hypothetical protein